MSALDDLRIIQHYIQHAYVTDGGISAECRGELATAIESLGETLVDLESRLDAAERNINTLQSRVRSLGAEIAGE